MESQPQNPEFRNNPENFHPCAYGIKSILHMYCCGTRKSHPSTRIICQKRGSAEFLAKLFWSEGGISLSHNNTS